LTATHVNLKHVRTVNSTQSYSNSGLAVGQRPRDRGELLDEGAVNAAVGAAGANAKFEAAVG
jgi:hypothetical protein